VRGQVVRARKDLSLPRGNAYFILKFPRALSKKGLVTGQGVAGEGNGGETWKHIESKRIYHFPERGFLTGHHGKLYDPKRRQKRLSGCYIYIRPRAKTISFLAIFLGEIQAGLGKGATGDVQQAKRSSLRKKVL